MYVKHTVLVCFFILCHPSAPGAEAFELTRHDAIRIALESNPEVVAARAVWEAAKARAVQAGAFPDPEFELEYEELTAAIDLEAFGERNLGATQAVEFPIKWWRRRRAAQQAAHATRLSVLVTTCQTISLHVKMVYDRVLLNRERLEFNGENLQLIQAFLTKTRLRREAGDVPSLDVIRAEVETGRAANRLTQVQSDLDEARATLNPLLGREIRTPFRLVNKLDYQPSSRKLSALKELALGRRPEIRGADSALARARPRQGAARAALLPDVRVGLFRQTINAPTGEEDFWRVGFGLELPLWGAVKQRGEQAEKKVQLFQGKITAAAERAFAVASRSYREGKATYLDVLEAQRALIEVREEFASALFDRCAALAQLEWATGGELAE